MDYNEVYYKRAVSSLQSLKYYYGDLEEDCAANLKRYFPNASTKEIAHAVTWAIADTLGGGCEIEVCEAVLRKKEERS